MNHPSLIRIGLVCTLLSSIAGLTAEIDPNSIPESEYVTVKDGHLSLRGKRIRFWGAIGSLVGKRKTIAGDPYYVQRKNVARIKSMGFNMIRFWHFDKYGPVAYKKGDLSRRDVIDFFLAECKRQGIYIWPAGLGNGGPLFTNELDEAAKIIDDPATEEAWKKAVAKLARKHYRYKNKKVIRLGFALPLIWDERLEKLAISRMKAAVQHLNRHTGLRYCDDPSFAIWEIVNEQWWTRKMTGGQWLKLPDFFKKSLYRKWHEYLTKKYGTEANIRKAWGFLLPGENLKQETILIAPLAKESSPVSLNDTNPHALEAFKTVAQKYGRKDFTFQRGADVMEFFTTLILRHKQRWAAALKTWGRSCKLAPVIFDTGIGYNAQSQFLHQNADAVSHCAYMEGFTFKDPTHKRYPFYSGLDAPPRICKDVPWLEHNKVEGKPFLCYETQMGNPGKFRAEFPLRLVALAAIQDWDAICFHYWHMDHYDYTKKHPYDGHLSFPGPGAYQYDYTHDEIAFSIRKAAGWIFRQGWLKPAPNPTRYIYGRKSLYDPAGMDYAGCYGKTGWNMLDTTYRYGVRIFLDPNREKDEVIGPQIRFNGFDKPNPIRPTDQIEFDYQRAHLIFDAPGAVAYTGFLAQYGADTIAWRHAPVRLENLIWNNPKNSPYPVTEKEKYLAFAMTSLTEAPLEKSNRIFVSLVSTSFNTGLHLDPDRKKNNYGKTPVLVTRVGGRIVSPILRGCHFRMIDFEEKVIAEGTISGDSLVIPADKPVFGVELSRP
ncbi:MAG: hypothetical protein D6820_02390 [Lentisphaerae bacterium]|nr:MAG: hypothetical protein D6820_02390 [Lentisphaerota bacterium]